MAGLDIYHLRTNHVCFCIFHFQAIPVCGHVYNFPLQLCGIWCSLCQPSGQPHGSEPRSSGQEQGHPSWCYFTQRAVHWEVSVSPVYTGVCTERCWTSCYCQLKLSFLVEVCGYTEFYLFVCLVYLFRNTRDNS